MILDEDPAFCRIYQSIFERAGYHVLMSSGRKSGLDLLKKENPQAVFIEIKINGNSREGICFIEEALRERPNLTIIVVSSEDDTKIIRKTLKRGTVDYLIKSSLDQIESRIKKIMQQMEDEIRFEKAVEKEGGLIIGPGQMIIGKSQSMWCVYELIQKVADDRCSALILGETGTGKGLIARAIHAGKDARMPFVSIDCGCIQKTLFESEMFGVRESYPGMHNKKKLIGKLEAVGAGTLLLDEIGNMNVDIQGSFLCVLQEMEFMPLGGERSVPFRAQVVASTNIDIESAIKEGRFRNDLYHRLNVVTIVLPPLRQRKEDISLLVQYHLDQHEKRSGQKVEILQEAMDKLVEYHWPGNIRELFHALRRVLKIHSSRYLIPEYFDFLRSRSLTGRETTSDHAGACREENTFNQMKKNNKGTYKERLAEFQKLTLLTALEENRWNQTLAAKQLDMNRTHFSELVNRLGIKNQQQWKKTSPLY